MISPADNPGGIEPRATLGISHLTILRNRGLSQLCSPEGDFDASVESMVGLYHRDARYLSRYLLTIGGLRPIPLDAHDRGFWLSATLTNPDMADAQGRTVPGESLVIRKQRSLTTGMSETITVANHGKSVITLPIEFTFDADFMDIFVVRGHRRQSEKPAVQLAVDRNAVTYRYMGLDDVARQCRIEFHPQPDELSHGYARFDVELERGASATIHVTACLDGKEVGQVTNVEVSDALREQRDWLEDGMSLESNSPRLDAVYRRSLSDLRALLSELDGRHFLAAGVPWFDALFGRDSLIAGMAALGAAPHLLRDSLFLLGKHQSSTSDPGCDAEPGKIPHELRFGELAAIKEVPFGAYFGSIDSTPLYVIACREYYRWTKDAETIIALWPHLHRAIEWCLARSRSSSIGALAYHRTSSDGLEHQGWKDSHDGVCHGDGSMVEGPVALIEPQAYLARAMRAYQDLCELVGERPRIDAEVESARVVELIASKFFADGEAVIGLDGREDPIKSAASNAGHVLWAGACSGDNAELIAERLMRKDMFNGWGIRTLSSEAPAYNPLGYHVGTIWPHDNAIILAGMRRYGMTERLNRLGGSLLQAMMGFRDDRIPELFSGLSRDSREFPTPYPVASRPQAWSAASLPWAMISLLGVTPGHSHDLHVVQPVLPPWLDWVRLKNLQFNSSSVDLVFRRNRNHVGVEVERQTGPGSVVLSAEWPLPPLA
jgi:glycogen debranching enzyme